MDLDEHTNALDDRDPAVREAAVGALDPLVALARYLVRAGTPEAIDAALPTIAGHTTDEERRELLGTLVTTRALTDERLQAILADRDRRQDDVRCLAAEILGRRGVAEGYRVLFGDFGCRQLYDEFIARGPEGIRIPCCAFPEFDDTLGAIAERLAARRKTTEVVVRELAAFPSFGGDRTAVEVLGYWDAPHNVELLMQIAKDPFRDAHVRREAIVSLCRIEAPEAMDLLIRTMLDPREEPWLRWECAEALGAIGKPEPTDALEWILRNDPDKLLRDLAREALEVIQNPAAA